MNVNAFFAITFVIVLKINLDSIIIKLLSYKNYLTEFDL